jgi:hypothetical protein
MNCCICGTVRNCGPYLDKIFSNMEILGSLFNDYRIIIYYDESTDNSLEKLKSYESKNSKMILHINTKPLLTYRTHRISLGRNFCIETIRNNFKDYPFFIMMDCDDKCARDINIDVLKFYLYRTSWDSLSFNHPEGYYDTWALSKLPYVLSCHHFTDSQSCQTLINKLIALSPPNKLIPCLSAFNGLAIYRTSKFIDCHYDGKYRTDYIPVWMKQLNLKINPTLKPFNNLDASLKNEDCEHRHFHIQACLKNNAKIRISPKCLFK